MKNIYILIFFTTIFCLINAPINILAYVTESGWASHISFNPSNYKENKKLTILIRDKVGMELGISLDEALKKYGFSKVDRKSNGNFQLQSPEKLKYGYIMIADGFIEGLCSNKKEVIALTKCEVMNIGKEADYNAIAEAFKKNMGNLIIAGLLALVLA
jgi:hypothetical protein